MRLKEHFTNYSDKVDRVTDVLFDGFKAEASHILKSKVDRTEVEDMCSSKFDHTRGRDIEKELKKAAKNLSSLEKRFDEMDGKIMKVSNN